MKLLLLHIAVVAALSHGAFGQPVNQALRRLCNAQSVCRECILASPMCTWCADPDYSATVRCHPDSDPELAACNQSSLQRPMGATNNLVETDLTQSLNQISPVSIDVSVRPGAQVVVPLTVRPARNFPIDLYLLMDLSFSMRDDLDNLKRLGALLAQSIVDISENFQIGFGSFVDKSIGPYTNLRPEIMNNPCLGDRDFPDGCRPTYSYRHVVSLTDDEAAFNAQVQAQTISGNQDAPEGGFDGLLQSILCTDLIGWRNVSRKLLLFITDAGFHFAGDGKLGGVIIPHDGTCRISSTSAPADYDDWNILDYPSIGQIALALRQQDIIPIFAAEAGARPFYDELVKELGDGAFVGTLASDSSNVVGLVTDLYNQISQQVQFDTQPVPGVSINVVPTTCPGEIKDGICTGVQIEQNAVFDVSVTIQQCTPQLESGPVTTTVRVVGFGSFDITLNAICSCDCENNIMVNSPTCSSNGTLVCGICECNQGRFGDRCQCDSTGQAAQMQMCPLGPTDVECTSNDRGTCICGVCNCRTDPSGEPLYYGVACECDDSRCPSSNGEICSNRGQCTCEGCDCNIEPNTQQPFFGPGCECTPNTNCIDPQNRTDNCNGRGICGCDGTCSCQNPYFGEYCELCSGDSVCFDLTCDSNSQCAECAINLFEEIGTEDESVFFNSANLVNLPSGAVLNSSQGLLQVTLPRDACEQCEQGVVIINGTEEVDYLIEGLDSIRCEVFDGEGCNYRYYVAIDEVTLEVLPVHVEFRRSCPEPQSSIPPWVIALSIIIPLLVLGLLALLLLKIFLIILDAIEVKKFEQELAKTKYSKNENPLYRSAAKDYANPIYGK